jgi:hypothetical protein
VRVGNALEHACGRAGLVLDRHHHDVLLLNLAEAGVAQASTRGLEIRSQQMYDAADFTVAVDVDA